MLARVVSGEHFADLSPVEMVAHGGDHFFVRESRVAVVDIVAFNIFNFFKVSDDEDAAAEMVLQFANFRFKTCAALPAVEEVGAGAGVQAIWVGEGEEAFVMEARLDEMGCVQRGDFPEGFGVGDMVFADPAGVIGDKGFDIVVVFVRRVCYI